ncbi:hypothetical protein ACFQ7J_07340 [Streptomyces sp. NPDC056501]|uniref:hypothetical protein n=1 Tax=Streptomyces sp. NPDC056501 TaxID=3345841 RepID=UPI0036CED61F
MDGWPGTKHPHTEEITGGREASPGYTPEQIAEDERLRALVMDLSTDSQRRLHTRAVMDRSRTRSWTVEVRVS